MPHGRVSAELCLLKATRCPPVPRTPCDRLFAERSGFVPPLQTPALVQGLAPSAPGWLSGASGHPEAGREPIAAARGQPGSQALGFSLGTGSSLGLHLCFCTWCRGWTPLSSEAPGHGGGAHRYCCRVSQRPALVSRSLVASTRTMLMKRTKLSCGNEGGLRPEAAAQQGGGRGRGDPRPRRGSARPPHLQGAP